MIRIDALSWNEAEEVLARAPGVVLPLGARLKEHGRHLPLNNDWRLAERLTDRVAERVAAEIVVLPTLELGYYPAFVDYPGTLHLEHDTAVAVLRDLGASVLRWGVSRLFVLNTGISTIRTLEAARIALEPTGLRFGYADPRRLGADAKAAVQTQVEGSHADEIETSMMLVLAPESVRMDRAEACVGPAGPGPLRRRAEDPGGLWSPSGVYGDPTLATVEKGRIVVDAVVRDLAAQVDAFFR